MRLSKKMEVELNKQLGMELYSANLYLSLSAYFEHDSFSGFANWAYLQYLEENTHAKRFFDYIYARNGRVIIEQIPAPKSDWDSMLNAIKAALAHEEKVTGLINQLFALAQAEKDYATETMLQWFINEQVKEVSDMTKFVHRIKFIDGSHSGMLYLDRQLSKNKPL
jgi:ferritin